MLLRFFLPRQVVFFKNDQQIFYYAIHFRWDGGFSLRERSGLIPKIPFILMLDSSLPYRRNFQFSIQQRVKKEFILASAAGLFPFALDEYLCSLGRKDAESYIFALKHCDYDAITLSIGQPAAVLVSDYNNLAMQSAIQFWLNNKAIYALKTSLIPIDPPKFLAGILSTVLLVLMNLTWHVWGEYTQENAILIQKQAAEIKIKADPLLHKRMVIAHMHSVNNALKKLSEYNSESLLRRLMPLLEALPENCFVENIQFENGKIEVIGWGSIPPTWFSRQGISEEGYQLNDLPKIDQFKFWLSL